MTHLVTDAETQGHSSIPETHVEGETTSKVMDALRRRRWKDQEFRASLCYIETLRPTCAI